MISSPSLSAGELINLDENCICEWLASIPAFFSETTVQQPRFVLGHSVLSWRYRNFRILMYRPFVIQRVIFGSKPPATEDGVEDSHEQLMTGIAIERCHLAAGQTISHITSFWSHPEHRNMLACWYALYFLFQAVMIPVISLRNDPQASNASSWRDQIRDSRSVLIEMCALNSAAEKCLGVIETLCGELLATNEDLQLPLPTDESPQTQLNNLYPLLWAPVGSDYFDCWNTTM